MRERVPLAEAQVTIDRQTRATAEGDDPGAPALPDNVQHLVVEVDVGV